MLANNTAPAVGVGGGPPPLSSSSLMDRCIVNVQAYTSASSWRRPEQLRGLLRNHPDLFVSRTPLAAPGNVFTSTQLALHNSENALAVAMTPLVGPGSLGLMPMAEPEPTLNAAARMRWLDLPGETKASSVAWYDDLLLLGSSRGRVLVADLTAESSVESSGLLQPCGALETSHSELPVGDVKVSASAHAASTMVRSVRVNAAVDPSRVVACKGVESFVWDLNGDGLPVCQWAPQRSEDDPSTVMFARWAPGSVKVVLTGTYEGTLLMVDTSCPSGPGHRNGLRFPLRDGYLCAAAEFNPALPFVFAASSSDGMLSIFDARYTQSPVLTLLSLQGDVSALQWMPLNPDLLLSAGTDGSVSMWCLRSSPTYSVGRAQFTHPLTDLAVTATYTEQRAYGMTLTGELTLTGLRTEAMMALAPSLTSELDRGTSHSGADDGTNKGRDEVSFGTPRPRGSSAQRGSGSPPPSPRLAGLAQKEEEDDERRACGLLYTRQLKGAYQVASQCASARFAQKETEQAMRLVALIDVNRIPGFDYDALLQRKCANSAAAATGAAMSTTTFGVSGAGGNDDGGDSDTWPTLGPDEARQAFEFQLMRASTRLCTTLPLERVRALSKPLPEDMRRLEALRLNVLLHQVLATKDAEKVAGGVQQALELLSAHPDSFELIDADVVCGIVSLLLQNNFAEGERFVQFLLALLVRVKRTASSVSLIRSILNTVQEPCVTGGLNTRATKRFEDRFYRDLNAAQDAVLTQLEIQRLGIEHYHEVISIVNAYQGRCIAQKQPGMFGWLGLKPLLLFLHCLTADSNYVTFFWASVQYIDAFARFPGVRQIETLLFAVVNRIHTAAGKITEDLDQFGDLSRFSVPQLRQTDTTLRTAHSFLSVLIRVQLECENVAIDSNMLHLPVVMERVQDVLNKASEDVLNAWAGVLEALASCGQLEAVRKYCMSTVREFSFAMEDLMEVSAKKENDERLNEILDECDNFFDSVGRRK